MPATELNLCMGCMTPLNADGRCPGCDHRDNSSADLNALPLRTVLAGRYLIGKTLAKNGEGFLYIAYDTEAEERVWVREYFPTNLAVRGRSATVTAPENTADPGEIAGNIVHPKKGKEITYKTLLANCEGILKKLSTLSAKDAVVPFRATVHANGTLYGIWRAMGGKPLQQHLIEIGGEMHWNDCRRPFLALCTTVSKLHKDNILHGGISPSTIWVDERGRLLLFGFGSTALRTEGCEIPEELFPGYSAPEQYEGTQWQGRWTDVYALAAVLYRILTGTMPPDAPSRKLVDNLTDASELSADVPANVSAAIGDALLLEPVLRTQSLEQFTAQLLEDVSSNTAVFPGVLEPQLTTADAAESTGTGTTATKEPTSRILKVLAAVVCVAVAVGAIALFVNYWMPAETPSETSSRELAPVPEPRTVPHLLGMVADSVTSDEEYTTQFDFYIKRIFSDRYANGVIVSQQPAAGTKMLNKGTVILTISLGKEVIAMPGLVGSQLQFATTTLTDLGIRYEIEEVEGAQYLPNVVARTSIAAGEDIHRVNDVITLYVGMASDIKEDDKSSSSPSSSGASSGLAGTRPAPPANYDFTWGGFVDNN